MMRKIVIHAIVGAAGVAMALSATVAQAAPKTVAATASVQLLKPVAVTNVSSLDFGTIVPGAVPSRVVVSASPGVPTVACDAAVTCIGTRTAANFNVTGTVGSVITISAPATATLSSITSRMTATLNTSASTLTLVAGTVNGVVRVGGILDVAANQPGGAYFGSFSISVDYQ